MNDVPPRKEGTGQKKKYGSREVNAIERTIEKNPHLTSRELKMRMPRLLKNLSARTVRRILDIDLDRPARVAPEKIFLTDEMKVRRVEWATTNLRRRKSYWESVLFIDEVMFEATGGGGSWRLVRRPRGTPRHDPKFCRSKYKKPRKVMALAGISASGARFLTFLPPGVNMNSEQYTKMMKGAPMRISRRDKLVILQDLSRVHTSKKTQAFFKKHQLNPLLLPGNSLDYRTMEKIVLHLLTPFSSQAILLTATLSSIVSPWSRGSWRRSPRGTWPR